MCLLHLSAPVIFKPHIQPLCLGAHGSRFPSGFPSWVAGWGALNESGYSPDSLQEVELPIVGLNECRCLNEVYVPEKTICAGRREGGVDSCFGDSGGPQVVRMNSIWVQVGVVSFGEGCARPERPGVYALVPAYQEWISQVVGTSSAPGFVLFDPPDDDSDEEYVCEYKNIDDYYYGSVLDSGPQVLCSPLFTLLTIVLCVRITL
ncbi:testisin-like [Boleophthalmus pectinirostris]|uniref:testisin-like n=1 Tax=Boleophthalmus pectinirostris TaxID=150288 RepID=UPI002430F906|nr:testisin-like [Boleophthalmus pectinirostris]